MLRHWPDVKVAHVESSGVGDTPELGNQLHLRAEIVLDGLTADDVVVHACDGRVDEHDTLHDVEYVTMQHVGNGGDTHRFEAHVPLHRTGAFGYTVRVIPHHELLSTVAELGLVTTA